MSKNLLRSLSILVATFLALLARPASALDVSGNIVENTTWTLAQSPIVMTGTVTVAVGATLTIEPGVSVLASTSGGEVELFVRGGLVSSGTSSSRITFGPQTGTTAGSWEGLRFDAGATAEIEFTNINYADYPLEFNAIQPGGPTLSDINITGYRTRGVNFLAVSSTTVTLTNVNVDGTLSSSGYGVITQSTPLNIVGGRFSRNAYGIYTTNATVTVTDAIIDNNTQNGLTAYSSSSPSFTLSASECTFYANADAVEVTRASTSYSITLYLNSNIFGENTMIVRDSGPSSSYRTSFASFSSNIYWNSTPATRFTNTTPSSESGSLPYNALLVDPANGNFEPTTNSPARYLDPTDPSATIGAVDYAGTPTSGPLRGFIYDTVVYGTPNAATVVEYDIGGDIVVAPGAYVRFLPNTRWKMSTTDLMYGGLDRTKIEIRVEGSMAMDGTGSRNVFFTSAATTPAAGNWYGIIITSTVETFNILQVDIGYAYRGVSLLSSPHIVAGTRIHDCSDAGVYVQGGTPQLELLDIQRAPYGVYVDLATLTLVDVDVSNCSVNGLFANESTVSWSGGVLHDNTQDAIRAFAQVGSRNLYLENVTIAHNGGDGVDVARNSTSYSYGVSLADTSITHNTGAGVRDSGPSSSYRFSMSCSGSNVWGNTGGNYASVTVSSTSCFAYNPLYVDAAARDYHLTRHSPNRRLGSSSSLVGALDYQGALGPQIEGYFWEDYSFTIDNSPYTVLGDLVIPNGITVTVDPGVEFRVSASDDMQGGTIASRVEVKVEAGGKLDMVGTGAPSRWRPASASTSSGQWQGFIVADGATTDFDNVAIEYPVTGIAVTGPRAPIVEDVTILKPSSYGITATDVNGTPDLDVLATSVIGNGSGMGVYLQNSDGEIKSSYFTHLSYGVYSTNTVSGFTSDLYVVNNTIVRTSTGVQYDRQTTSATCNVFVTNNVISRSTSFAVRDAQPSSSYSCNDRLQNNVFHSVNTTSGTFDVNSGNYTSFDPLVEDDDWDTNPRWWDGKLWLESNAKNAGLNSAARIPTRDILNKARIITTVVDIGAWEFDPTANQEPRADAVTASIMVARGEPFTFDGTAAFDPDGTIASSFWTMSDGTVTAGQSVSHTFASLGENQWGYITVIDDDAAEDHARVLVNVNERPVADAGPEQNQDAGDPAEFCQFDGSASADADGSIPSYVWNFGDGSATATGVRPQHVYASAGTYLVTLTITDNEGLTDTDTTFAYVFGPVDTAGPLVLHTEIANGQPIAQPVMVSADIQDPSGIAGAIVYYRTKGTTNTKFAAMTNTSGNRYEAVIPGADVTSPGVEYWILTVDSSSGSNATTYPTGAPDSGILDFLVTGDPNPPTIVHTEIADGQVAGTAQTVTATITDATGVASASLYFRVQGTGTGGFGAVPMSLISGTTWSAQIPSFVVAAPGVDYYIEATDTSPIPNSGRSPSNAPTTVYNFAVSTGDTTPPVVAHSAIANGQAAGTPIVVSASVADSSGVASVSAFYRAAGGTTFTEVAFVRGSGTTWSGSIPGAAVVSPGMNYYLRAADTAGNASFYPEGAPGTFLSFTVTAVDSAGPSITHTPVPNGQTAGVAVVVSATVTDSSGLSTVRLHYRQNGIPFYQEIVMTHAGGGVYTATIPAFAIISPRVDYYIRAVDTASNTSYSPTSYATTPNSFTVVTQDTQAPTIAHTPVADGQIGGSSVAISAAVLDNNGVSAVTLYYRAVGASTWTSAALSNASGSTWSGSIPGAAVTVAGVQYYLEASDAQSNLARDPSTAPTTPHDFTVVAPDLEGPTIVHTPVGNDQTNGAAVTISAVVVDSSGVGSVVLSWRRTGDATWTNAAMTNSTGSTWTATIPGSGTTGTGVQYYITAVDTAAALNDSAVPVNAPLDYYAFTIRPNDTAGPVISHSAPTSMNYGSGLTLTATVTDATSVSSVVVQFSSGSRAYVAYPMVLNAGTWSVAIPAAAITSPDATARYYIVATDGVGNVSSSPSGGVSSPNVVTVVYPDTTGPTLSLANIAASITAGVALNVSATATDTSGVASVTFYYRAGGTGSYTTIAGTGPSPWTAQIPGSAIVVPLLEVYAVAFDTIGNSSTSAADTATVVLPPDVTAPVIVLSSIPNGQPENAAVTVSASITDDRAVTTATLYHRRGGTSTWSTQAMSNTSGTTWQATIGAASVAQPRVEYYVQAADAAGNSVTAPSTGATTPAQFTVVAVDASGPTLSHTLPTGTFYAGDSVPLRAVANDSSGVASVTLYYRVTGASSFSSVALTASGANYDAVVPNAAAPGFQYYFEARDTLNNVSRLPTNAPTGFYDISVGARDTTAPTIAHTEPAEAVLVGTPTAIVATITDSSDVAAANLYYRRVGTTTFTLVPMAEGLANEWSAVISAGSVLEPGIEYYLEATDGSIWNNVGVSPSTAPIGLWSFDVQAAPSDTTPPQVAHSAITGTRNAGEAVGISALVTDTSGVSSVTLYFRPTGSSTWFSSPMSLVSGSWVGSIPAFSVAAPGMDYYIEAQDAAPARNRATSPALAPAAWHAFAVVVPDTTGPSVTVSPIADGQVAGTTVAVVASIADASGVSSANLYFRTSGTTSWLSVPMVAGAGSSWTASVPAFAVAAPGVDFYVEATDTASNVSLVPTGAPAVWSDFTVVVPDTTGPTLSVTSVPDGQQQSTDVVVNATATDVSGVASVSLHFRVQGDLTWLTVPMTLTSGSNFQATIPAVAVRSPAVEYYVTATDSAASANVAYAPVGAPTAFSRFTVLVPDTAAPTITHALIGNNQVAGSAIVIRANVVDSTGVASVSLFYKLSGAGSFVESPMTGVGADYTATIPGAAVASPGLEYYVRAVDSAPAANTGYYPPGAPSLPATFTVIVPDTTGPLISHSPIANGQTAGAAMRVEATITDPSGVAEATLYFRTRGAPTWLSSPMGEEGSLFSAEIPAFAVSAPGVQYYIAARDSATGRNLSLSPSGAPTAFYEFTVLAPDTTAPSVSVASVVSPQPASAPVTVTATATDASGILSVTLYYRPMGELTWISAAMTNAGGTWTGTIAAFAVVAPGVEYYVAAIDNATGRNTGFAPTGAPGTFNSFAVLVPDTAGPELDVNVSPEDVTAGTPITWAVAASDDSGVERVTLFYAPAGTAEYIEVELEEGDLGWAITVDGAEIVEGDLYWFIEAVDTLGNVTVYPADGETDPALVSVEPAPTEDVVGPTILHLSTATVDFGDDYLIEAIVTDASAVSRVTVWYRSEGATAFERLTMVAGASSRWSATVVAAEIGAADLEYYLEAQDASVNANLSTEPVAAPTDWFTVSVLGIPTDGAETDDVVDDTDATDDTTDVDPGDATDTTDTSDVDPGDVTDADDTADVDPDADDTTDVDPDAEDTADTDPDAVEEVDDTSDASDDTTDTSDTADIPNTEVDAGDTTDGDATGLPTGTKKKSGCSSTTGATGSLWMGLALLGLIVLRRRRR